MDIWIVQKLHDGCLYCPRYVTRVLSFSGSAYGRRTTNRKEKMEDKFKKTYRKVARKAFEVLKDERLTHHWMVLKNDIFGGKSPVEMIHLGKAGKVIKSIKNYVQNH